jgi:transposase
MLWSGKGRDEATLRRFFDELGAEKAGRIDAVCCDMWSPYVEVLKERVPKATLYIWLKNPWNLTDKQRERLSFQERINLKVPRARSEVRAWAWSPCGM